MFDENIFPFAALHQNAGARLPSEVLLIPQNSGGSTIHNRALDSPPNPNLSAENSDENSAGLEENQGDFMCPWIHTPPAL